MKLEVASHRSDLVTSMKISRYLSRHHQGFKIIECAEERNDWKKYRDKTLKVFRAKFSLDANKASKA